jgi:hypothetical protein
MARNPNFGFAFTWRDAGGESARMTINTASLIGTDPVPATVTALQVALANITDGAIINLASQSSVKLENLAYAADGHREDRWRVYYEDATTYAVYTNDIPCRQSGLATVPGTDFVDLDDGSVWAAFKTAFEALARSPDGNAVHVLKVEYVGRNS